MYTDTEAHCPPKRCFLKLKTRLFSIAIQSFCILQKDFLPLSRQRVLQINREAVIVCIPLLTRRAFKMRLTSFITTLALVLPLSAGAQENYIHNAQDYLGKVDWNAMETVTITMTEHHYEPTDVKFKVGKPYKVELKNKGNKDHYYTAPEFFRNVAWRKVMVNNQAEVKAPYFTAVEVLKNGGQLDLYFVPVTKGSYPVYCTIEGHRQEGMEGSLLIE